MNQLLHSAIQASLDAGKAILDIYYSSDFGIELKADDSPLTLADLASHKIIFESLTASGIPILSEEGKSIPYLTRKNYTKLWIVDPIDGTKEFIQKNGDFTVNIALVENGSPILGVIYAPALSELYYASPEGSFKASGILPTTTLDDIQKICEPLPTRNLSKEGYRIVASRSHLSKETSQFIDNLSFYHDQIVTVSRGSSIKLCLIAEGSAHCYPRFSPTMEWDIAAGHAICKYSGAKIIDRVTGKEMVYNRENLVNNSFIAERSF